MFRVVADQLKLRGGLVRCGSCRHVFDAIGSLSYVDDAVAAPTARGTAAAQAPSPAEPMEKDTASGPLTLRIDPGPARAADGPEEASASRVEPRASSGTAEAGPPTLLAGDAHPVATEAAPELEEARRQRRAQRRRRPTQERREDQRPAEAPAEAPAFLREQRRAGRGFSVFFGGGSLLLLALLLAQLAIVFRSEVLIRFPAARPLLLQLCSWAGCSVGWPARADLLAVVGSELQAVPGTDILELTAVIRNRARFKVALPAIEVTLTDVANRVVARKVFAPVDYLASAGEPSSRIDEGLGAGADYTVRVSFEARGLSAAGFVVYPFYL